MTFNIVIPLDKVVLLGIFEDGAARANKVSDSDVLKMWDFLASFRNDFIMFPLPTMCIASCDP